MSKKKSARPSLPFRHIKTLGLLPMSDCILTLIEPYRSVTSSTDEIKKLAMLGIIGWNLAISTEQERQNLLDTIPLTDYTEFERADFIRLLEALESRKKQLFPDDRRRPINLRVHAQGNDWRLEVASALPV
jgi:hypothetical protein